MRRHEFAVIEKSEIDRFLQSQRVGVLSVSDEHSVPYAIPMNYIWFNEHIYLHSALTGKKITLLRRNPAVQFTVYKEYAYIPSYVSDPQTACSASQFFKSVMIVGQAAFLEAMPEKCDVLDTFMQTFQPEGRYVSLHETPRETTILPKTAIIQIEPHDITAKFKFGQHLKPVRIQQILVFLEQRNTENDRETIAMIKRYHP
jgi:nitroimidazol reductase NimA-like FMN-containing flavoprotein (pyridoxamine 5'-phosphate oxidase superfamily)